MSAQLYRYPLSCCTPAAAAACKCHNLLMATAMINIMGTSRVLRPGHSLSLQSCVHVSSAVAISRHISVYTPMLSVALLSLLAVMSVGPQQPQPPASSSRSTSSDSTAGKWGRIDSRGGAGSSFSRSSSRAHAGSVGARGSSSRNYRPGSSSRSNVSADSAAYD